MSADELYRLLTQDDWEFPDNDDRENDPDWLQREDDQPDEFDAVDTKDTSWKGKNGHEWHVNPLKPPLRKTTFKTLIAAPKAVGPAKGLLDAVEIWRKLIDDDIISTIVRYTNQEMEARSKDRHKKQEAKKSGAKVDQSYHHPTYREEIMAFIGLLYIIGVYKNAKVNVKQLWSRRFGIAIHRTLMSEQRFGYLTSCIRFDDRITRTERQYKDNFAPIRDVWEKFEKNCTKNLQSVSFSCDR